MSSLHRVLVVIGVAVGAVGFGAVASAAVDGIGGGTGDEAVGPVEETPEPTTTETPEPPSTEPEATEPGDRFDSPTPEVPADEEEQPAEPPAEEVPDPDPDAADDAPPESDGPPDAALFGLCNAFSGREQPGDSQAWARLNERAGGDIEGFCAEVLAAHPADRSSANPVPAGPRQDAGPRPPVHAGPPAHAGPPDRQGPPPDAGRPGHAGPPAHAQGGGKGPGGPPR